MWQYFEERGLYCYCVKCEEEKRKEVKRYSMKGGYSKNIKNHLRNEHGIELSKGDGKNEASSTQVETKLHKIDPKVAQRMLAEVVTENCLALRFVESKALGQFALYLNPDFKVPPRQKLTKKLIPSLKAEIVAVIEGIVSSVRGFSFTLDGWRSAAGAKFLVVTFHTMDEDWKQHHFVLGLMPFDESRATAKEISILVCTRIYRCRNYGWRHQENSSSERTQAPLDALCSSCRQPCCQGRHESERD
jgi:hypothetical protein